PTREDRETGLQGEGGQGQGHRPPGTRDAERRTGWRVQTAELIAGKLARSVRWGEVGKVPSWQLDSLLPKRSAVVSGRPTRKTYAICGPCATTPERRICGQGRHARPGGRSERQTPNAALPWGTREVTLGESGASTVSVRIVMASTLDQPRIPRL